MRRFAEGHVPEYGSPHDRLAECSCGFLALTFEEVRDHAYDPQPEPVWAPPEPEFRYDLTPAGKNAEVGCAWRRWKQRPAARTVAEVLGLAEGHAHEAVA